VTIATADSAMGACPAIYPASVKIAVAVKVAIAASVANSRAVDVFKGLSFQGEKPDRSGGWF